MVRKRVNLIKVKHCSSKAKAAGTRAVVLRNACSAMHARRSPSPAANRGQDPIDDGDAPTSPSASELEQRREAASKVEACAEWRISSPKAAAPAACGPAAAHHAGQPHALPTVPPIENADPELRAFWERLPARRGAELLRVPRKDLFERIRAAYCSRCYGLFSFRYDELRT